MAIDTGYEHIALDAAQVAIISGTTMKVIELILAQLAYYWDHRDSLDLDIERRLQAVNQIRASAGYTPLVTRFRDQGLI